MRTKTYSCGQARIASVSPGEKLRLGQMPDMGKQNVHFDVNNAMALHFALGEAIRRANLIDRRSDEAYVNLRFIGNTVCVITKPFLDSLGNEE